MFKYLPHSVICLLLLLLLLKSIPGKRRPKGEGVVPVIGQVLLQRDGVIFIFFPFFFPPIFIFPSSTTPSSKCSTSLWKTYKTKHPPSPGIVYYIFIFFFSFFYLPFDLFDYHHWFRTRLHSIHVSRCACRGTKWSRREFQIEKEKEQDRMRRARSFWFWNKSDMYRVQRFIMTRVRWKIRSSGSSSPLNWEHGFTTKQKHNNNKKRENTNNENEKIKMEGERKEIR